MSRVNPQNTRDFKGMSPHKMMFGNDTILKSCSSCGEKPVDIFDEENFVVKTKIGITLCPKCNQLLKK